jgi:hypothetical protein
MSSRRLIIYLLILAVTFFVLRPRESWTNMKQMYEHRRWLIGVISTILIIYLIYGFWQIWRQGLWWLAD